MRLSRRDDARRITERAMREPVRFLVFGVSAAEWTRRYGVQPFEYPCYVCGRLLATSIPFAQGELRGLAAPQCACGDKQGPYAAVRDPALGDLLMDVPARSSKAATRKRTACRVLRWRAQPARSCD